MKKVNRLRLITLMEEYRVDCEEVAWLLGLSLPTVYVYRSSGGKDIPRNSLDLLRYKLQEKYGTTAQ